MKKCVGGLVAIFMVFIFISAFAEQDMFDLQRRIVFNEKEFYVLTDEGKIIANPAGYEAHPEIKDWNDLVSLRVSWDIAAGLRSDGTVCVSIGAIEDKYIMDLVCEWYDIIQIAVAYKCVYGLTKNNEIVYAGYVSESRKRQLEESQQWGHISYITAYTDLVALTDDGHVYSTMVEDFSHLDHIIDIITNGMDYVFLKDDGTEIIYTEWEEGVGTFFTPEVEGILQITFFDFQEIAELNKNHEFIAPKYSSLSSFTDPEIVAISGSAWIDNKGKIHMDQTKFGLEDVNLPCFDLSR